MADSVTLRVDGLQALGRSLERLKTDVALKLAGRATGKAASVVKKAAKNNIRSSPSVETGSLLDAVIAKKIPKSQTALTAEHIVTVRRRSSGRKTKNKQATAPHARFVEYGTVNMPPEPFLGPALSRNITEATRVIADTLSDGIVKASR